MTQDIITYEGVPLEELSREKLIEAARHAFEEYQRESAYHRATISIHALARFGAQHAPPLNRRQR